MTPPHFRRAARRHIAEAAAVSAIRSTLEDRTKPTAEVALDLQLEARLYGNEDAIPVEVVAHPSSDACSSPPRGSSSVPTYGHRRRDQHYQRTYRATPRPPSYDPQAARPS